MKYRPLPGQRVTMLDNRGICVVADEYECRKHTPLTEIYMRGSHFFVGLVREGKWQGWFNWYVALEPVDHLVECSCGRMFLLKDDYICNECRAA